MRITGAGLRESHVHDITVTREAPNYPGGQWLILDMHHRIGVAIEAMPAGQAVQRCAAAGEPAGKIVQAI